MLHSSRCATHAALVMPDHFLPIFFHEILPREIFFHEVVTLPMPCGPYAAAYNALASLTVRSLCVTNAWV